MRRVLRLVAMMMLLVGVSMTARAEVRVVKIGQLPEAGEIAPVDFAGKTLRAAVNAWETAADNPLPFTWTRLTAARGISVPISQTVHFLALEVKDSSARILVVDDEGPHDVQAETGKETTAGALRVMYLFPEAGGGVFLVRSATEQPVSSFTKPARPSALRITGDFETHEIVLQTDDERLMDFAICYLDELMLGMDSDAAAREAFNAVPPPTTSIGNDAAPPAREDVYTDPRNIRDDPDGGALSALITVRVVRGDSASLNSLASGFSYNSRGRANDSPAVTVQGDGTGGRVSVGSPGDAFRARLAALEASGAVRTESETMLTVGFGDYSDLSIAGPRGAARASIHLERRGRESALVDIRQREGDWSFAGSVNSRLVLRNGQTRMLAGNTSSVQSSQSSGVPILQDIPYAGPLFGSESSSSSTSSYAVFVSLEFQ